MTQHNPSDNSHVTEYLDYYCNLPDPPGFAVLLKGEWGSGKTWFIKRYCESLREKKRKCLYVSLNGVTSFSEIEEAFLQQQIPFLASKPVAIGRNLITQILKNSLKLDVNNDATLNLTTPSIKLTELFTNLDQSILIFDDLERCNIPLGNILGYINSFVEQKELKVIILADEERLKKDDYKVFKEKVIGQALAISLEFDKALENFGYAIKKRYEFDDNNEKLLEELDWLKSVRDSLLDEAARRKGKPSGHSLQVLIEHDLNEAIQKLEETAHQLQQSQNRITQ